jgi:hypothetical protein
MVANPYVPCIGQSLPRPHVVQVHKIPCASLFCCSGEAPDTMWDRVKITLFGLCWLVMFVLFCVCSAVILLTSAYPATIGR